MQKLLEKNEDGSRNFHCRRLISSEGKVTKSVLEASIEKMLNKHPAQILFYFAGHGAVANGKDGYLICELSYKIKVTNKV